MLSPSDVRKLGLPLCAQRFYFRVQRLHCVLCAVYLLCRLHLCIAFSDVICDAIMVEEGQPIKVTSQLQTIQNTSNYVAVFIAGALGGYFASKDKLQAMFWASGATYAAITLIVLIIYSEKKETINHTFR